MSWSDVKLLCMILVQRCNWLYAFRDVRIPVASSFNWNVERRKETLLSAILIYLKILISTSLLIWYSIEAFIQKFFVFFIQAASLLEKAGINPQAVMAAANAAAMVGPGGSKMERVNYCNILLPLPQPLVPDNSPIVQRLFIVCQPSAVSERVLRDAFSRFGNLIDVFLLSGKETAGFHCLM